MNKIEDAIQTVHKLDKKQENDFLNNIHPLPKLLITILYIILLTSINKYDLIKTLSMAIFLILVSIVQDISLKDILKRFKTIFFILIILGIANLIFDRNIIYIGNVRLRAGIISMVTLILKGFFVIISSYFLIITTKIEEICYSLKLLHCPNILITTIMLIYRYIILFLKEAQRIWVAYKMRAPKQKGINYKAWGSLVGSFMIRSIDKAEIVYQAMELRGFNPNTFFIDDRKFDKYSVIYLIFGTFLILFIRYIPIFEFVGNLFI